MCGFFFFFVFKGAEISSHYIDILIQINFFFFFNKRQEKRKKRKTIPCKIHFVNHHDSVAIHVSLKDLTSHPVMPVDPFCVPHVDDTVSSKLWCF